jgi:lysozyme family protein
MALFDEEFEKIILAEGGYTNDSDDAGGETYLGISRNNNPKWDGWISIDQLKKHHPKDFKKLLKQTPELTVKAKRLYKENYWDVLELDDIPSQGIAHQLFDTAVNMGVSSAIRIAQQVIGMTITGKWSEELKYNLMQYGKGE